MVRACCGDAPWVGFLVHLGPSARSDVARERAAVFYPGTLLPEECRRLPPEHLPNRLTNSSEALAGARDERAAARTPEFLPV